MEKTVNKEQTEGNNNPLCRKGKQLTKDNQFQLCFATLENASEVWICGRDPHPFRSFCPRTQWSQRITAERSGVAPWLRTTSHVRRTRTGDAQQTQRKQNKITVFFTQLTDYASEISDITPSNNCELTNSTIGVLPVLDRSYPEKFYNNIWTADHWDSTRPFFAEIENTANYYSTFFPEW